MAANEPDDIDKLLADVERSLNPAAPPPRKLPARQGASAAVDRPGRTGGGLTSRLRMALLTAALIAGVVAVLAFFLPAFSVWSGTLGAFIGALVAGLVAAVRR